MKKCLAVILIILSSLSCSSMPNLIKMAPEYKGIDPQIQSYYDEYIALAKLNKISFKGKVTIGFKEIKDEHTVGLCTKNGIFNFREIDIDRGWWKDASATSRTVLIFHELGHCLCGREHDFKENQYYPDPYALKIFKVVQEICSQEPPKGLYDDQCPLSLMYPSVVPYDCAILHYPDYIKEMFDRCNPW